MGAADLTVKKLKGEMGFAAVFIGIGNPEPKKIPIFEKLDESHGFFTSKDFLPKVKKTLHYGILKCGPALKP